MQNIYEYYIAYLKRFSNCIINNYAIQIYKHIRKKLHTIINLLCTALYINSIVNIAYIKSSALLK